MTQKTYALVEKNETRTQGWQVTLTLREGRFVLTRGVYTSDWGDKHEQSTTHYGTYTEEETAITCKAERREDLDQLHRHEEGDGHKNRTQKPADETFIFVKEGEALRCPLAFETALGKALRQEVTPIKLF